MVSNISDRSRAHAGVGEVALGVGAVAALRAGMPSITKPGFGFRAAPTVLAVAGGLAVGALGEAAARGIDAGTDADRTQSHLILAGAGAAAAIAGAHVNLGSAKLIGSTGRVLAIAGLVGAGLDLAHDRYDTNDDGRFFPEVPIGVRAAVGGAALLGVGLKVGPRLITAIRNKDMIGGTAEAVDQLSTKYHELIPRSKLTTGPQVFLGTRVEEGLGGEAIRTVVPHELDAPELRTSLGLPATGKLTEDQLAQIGIHSANQQGVFELDDAGRPMVDVIFEGSPTGMGGMNAAPLLTQEQLARTFTIDAQYGAKPSVQSLGKVETSIDAFVATSKAMRDRVAQMPEGARPPRIGVATSLGGLAFDELFARHGVGILDELGLEKVVTLGAPTKLSKLDRLPADFFPEGFHIRATFDEFDAMSEEEVAKARFIELRHPDDPVPLISLSMIYRKPDWWPDGRTWVPGVSFLQHAGDVTTAISRGTGPTVGAGGHEYRVARSNAAFVRAVGLRAKDGSAYSPQDVQRAALVAQEAAVTEAARIRDVLTGKTKATPAPHG